MAATRVTRTIFLALILVVILLGVMWIVTASRAPTQEAVALTTPAVETPRPARPEEASPRPAADPIASSPNAPTAPTPDPTALSEASPTPTLYMVSEIQVARRPATPSAPDSGESTPLPAATGRIEIPSLGHDHSVVPVSWRMQTVDGERVAMWDTVKGAVGHHRGSAPLGGPGNSVLTGHTRGDGMGEFQNIWDLQEGQEIRVYDGNGLMFVYLVESVNIIQEVGLSVEQRYENAKYMAPTDDTRLTLVTCWPEWVYTHRVIVIAKPA